MRREIPCDLADRDRAAVERHREIRDDDAGIRGTAEKQGKVIARYHIPGSHGGAWIYDVASNEELDMLLARSPVFNYSRYEVYPLADMEPPCRRSPGSTRHASG